MAKISDSFREFLGILPGAESLDDPNVLAPSVRIKRADYLIFQRSMIAEVKQLEANPAFKVEAVLERYKSHPSYPVFFGQRTLTAVLDHMPAELQEEIRQAAFESITRSIANSCEEANRQIRETRAYFGLVHASGVMYILNDDISILSPDVLGARVEQQMHKRTADGKDRFPEIAYVCVLTWAHFVRGTDGVPAHPILIVEGPAAKAHSVASNQLSYVLHAWSSHSGARLMFGGNARKEHLEDYGNALSEGPPANLTRSEARRSLYRAKRYLQSLSEQGLFDQGRAIFKELSPHFLKGEKGAGDPMEITNRWTDFLEECELRNIDMKRFRPLDENEK